MRSGGITRRWGKNTLSFIILILVVVNVCSSVALKSYYYQMAESTIDSKVQKTAMCSKLYFAESLLACVPLPAPGAPRSITCILF